MKKQVIFTDVDGVLLDMNKTYWKSLGKLLGKDVWGAVPHWDYRQVAGISKEKGAELWKMIWETPLELYSEAIKLIAYCTGRGISIIACSMRPSGAAQQAALRDFPKLGIPWTTFDTSEAKTAFVKRMYDSWEDGELLYLEDNWGAADDVSRHGVETFLINANYNSSKDLDVEYKRVNRHELVTEVHFWSNKEIYSG